MSPCVFVPRVYLVAKVLVMSSLALGCSSAEPISLQEAKKNLDRGMEAMGNKNYDLAITLLTEALRHDPKNAQAYLTRGKAFFLKKELDRANADFTQAIRHDPNVANAHYNRGVSFEQKGEFAKAISDYTEALRLDPNDVQALTNCGTCFARTGATDRAIEDFEKAIRLDPRHPLPRHNLGRAFEDKKDFGRAIAAYSEVILLAPNERNARVNRAKAYRAWADSLKARKMPLHPEFDVVPDLAQLARWNVTRQEFERVLKDFDEKNRDKAPALEDLRNTSIKFTNSVVVNPSPTPSATGVGVKGSAVTGGGSVRVRDLCQIIEYRNKYDRAIADWTAAIRISPNDVEAFTERAALHRILGDQDKATADEAKVKELRRVQP